LYTPGFQATAYTALGKRYLSSFFPELFKLNMENRVENLDEFCHSPLTSNPKLNADEGQA